MATHLTYFHTNHDDTLYAIVTSDAGTAWNGSALETYDETNWATYDITGALIDASGDMYGFDLTDLTAGYYTVRIYQMLGAAVSADDTCIAARALTWDGTEVSSSSEASSSTATCTVLFHFETEEGGDLTGQTAYLSDETEAYGVKRNDTDEAVVDDATEMTEVGGGWYSYTFTEPDTDLTYTASGEITYDEQTIWQSKTFTGSTSTAEPLSLTDAKHHLRVDTTDDDTYISALIVAAREYAEIFLGRKLMTGTLTQYFDTFSDAMELKRPPLASVTSITYVDSDGDTQTLADTVYDVDITVEPGLVRLAYDQSWPTIRTTPNAITITYVAGYGDATDVPKGIRQAMLLLISNWYENREATLSGTIIAKVPLALESLLLANRMPGVC